MDSSSQNSHYCSWCVVIRDAMPQGGTITIAGQEQTIGSDHISGLAPGRYVCLSVSDTGQGMDEATLARAMEPFFTTKGIGKGTGMGLSMVHGLAAQSGGRLVLKSRKDEGTTAEIWLPAIQVPATAPAEAARKADAASPGSDMRALTILVVDDDALVLQSTAAMLADLGHRVLEAGSGREALEYLGRAQSVDVVITDQAMPGMTGMQLAATIKQQRPDLPVILASGYADLPLDLELSLIRLSKPFGQDRLAQAINGSIQNASAGKVIRLRPR